MSVFVERRCATGDQPTRHLDVGSESDQMGNQFVGGGVKRFIGHRVERVEDE